MSCDVWFYQVGNLVGVDKIAKWAKLFGFGEKTGLDLNMELPGIVPSTSWKLRTRGVPWQQGDTINISIGQGYNLTTPIQLANAYAAIAKGGTLYRPYVLRKIVNEAGQVVESGAPKVIRKIEIKESVLAVIHQALKDVVHSPIGTAQKIRLENVTISGKTGTAQNAALKRTKDAENVQLLQKDHAWFAAYSPSETPQIVVVVLSEYDGGGGGSQAAPIAREVISAFWHKRDPEKFPRVTSATQAMGAAAGSLPAAGQQHDSGSQQSARPPTRVKPEVIVPPEAPELPQNPALYLEERPQPPGAQGEQPGNESEGD
jgi:penicillin-binding protein 2